MRLLVVSHNYPRRSATGSGLFIHRLNRGLAARGIDVHVLQRAEWSPPRPVARVSREWRESRQYRDDLYDVLDGIPIHHPETVHPRPSRFFEPDVWVRQVRSILRYVERRPLLARADAVMGHFLVPDGFHAVRLAKHLGIPSCAMAWGDDVHAWPAGNAGWRDKLLTVLRECDRLVACSDRLAEDGAAWADHPTAWDTVYAGTDLERFHPPSAEERRQARQLVAFAAVPADAPVLLMVGQPVEAKGYLELLGAWETLSREISSWHLVMIGANWGNVDVKAQIAARGLSSRAHWLGPQQAETIPGLLRGADALVLPSHNEGLSLSVMEAMATALPVVTTDVGGHREILRHGENGWLIPPRDQRALEGALRELMTRAELRTTYGAAARRTIEGVGSPEDNAGRLERILRGLVATGGAPRGAPVASGTEH